MVILKYTNRRNQTMVFFCFLAYCIKKCDFCKSDPSHIWKCNSNRISTDVSQFERSCCSNWISTCPLCHLTQQTMIISNPEWSASELHTNWTTVVHWLINTLIWNIFLNHRRHNNNMVSKYNESFCNVSHVVAACCWCSLTPLLQVAN